MAGDAGGGDDCGAGDSVCGAGPGGDGGDGAAFGGVGAKLMAAAILVSTFGCVNGMLLAGARVYYAMSQDGLFFKAVGKLSERSKTPVNSLWVQWAWTCLLCLSGKLWAVAGLRDLCGAGLLYPDDCGAVCAAADAAGCGAAV